MISIEFPIQGEYIEIELQNDTGRIKFQSDINRKNKLVNKVTLQLRHKNIYIIRRLDLMGNHRNPPGPVPDPILMDMRSMNSEVKIMCIFTWMALERGGHCHCQKC